MSSIPHTPTVTSSSVSNTLMNHITHSRHPYFMSLVIHRHWHKYNHHTYYYYAGLMPLSLPSPARTLPLSLPAVLPAPSHGHLHYPASGVKDVTARTSHYNAFLIASSTDDDPYQSPFSQRMRIRRRGRQSIIMARLHPLPPPSPPQEYTETFSLRDHLHKQMFAVLFYVVSKQTLGAL